ncbi:MAG TPA: DoxX family protein [Chitinophagaceae bacterium]|nr:DoxX family protein [Chitinophagaceae bacterium]
MTDGQAYIIIAAGFATMLAVLILGKEKLKLFTAQFYSIGFTAKTFFVFLVIAALPFTKYEIVKEIAFTEIARVVSFFFAGGVIGYYLIYLVRLLQRRRLALLSAEQVGRFCTLFRWMLAGNFILAGLSKILFPAFITSFFKTSGYSISFLYFITGVEILCGAAMFFKKLTIPASAILIIDMAGAAFTHYHNYFSRGIPGPLGNSVPSLIMQPYLITVLVISLQQLKKRNNPPGTEVHFLLTK